MVVVRARLAVMTTLCLLIVVGESGILSRGSKQQTLPRGLGRASGAEPETFSGWTGVEYGAWGTTTGCNLGSYPGECDISDEDYVQLLIMKMHAGIEGDKQTKHRSRTNFMLYLLYSMIFLWAIKLGDPLPL